MEIVIYGAGLLGKKTLGILREQEILDVIGFVDDDPLMIDMEVCGLKVIGHGRDLKKLRRFGVEGICIALPDGDARIKISRLCHLIGIEVTGAVSPSAKIDPDASVGRGNIISENAVVKGGAVLGDCCYVAPGAIVESGATVESGGDVHAIEGDFGAGRAAGNILEPV